MSSEVVSVTETAPILEALHQLINTGSDVLPVLTGRDELAGLLSEVDVIRHLMGSGADADAFRRWTEPTHEMSPQLVDALKAPVSAAMTRNVITVGEDTRLREVAAIMLERHFKQIPVMRGRSVVGFVHRCDLLRAALSQTEGKAPPKAIDDELLRSAVTASLRRLGVRLGRGFDVVVNGSVAHLWGEVDDDEAYRACAAAAAEVEGVTDVSMHMQVMPQRRVLAPL